MEQLSLDIEVGMFERLTEIHLLRRAAKSVLANKGSAGIDGVTVEEYRTNLNDNLEKIIIEIKEWRYKPSPVRRVEIPKPGTNKTRQLGIPTIKDRVVQQAIRLIIEPLFEKDFHNNSYGFRPKRGQQNAIEQAKQYISEEGREWIIDIDLEKYFDTINHDRLITKLMVKIKDKRIIKLIAMILKSGSMQNEMFNASEQGAPQGSPLSPLLSNIYLHELDIELDKRGLKFCRYADDCNIYVKSKKAAETRLTSITKFIEGKMKLKVNKEKSKATKSDKVKFLGISIINNIVVIATASTKRAMTKIKEIIPRRTHIPFDKQMLKVNQWYRGWSSYYRITEMPSQLRAIEAHIRRRFRAQFIAHSKRARTLHNKMHPSAGKPNVRNRGIWKTSNLRPVTLTWNNDWFERRGFKITSSAKLQHWKPIDFWFNFT